MNARGGVDTSAVRGAWKKTEIASTSSITFSTDIRFQTPAVLSGGESVTHLTYRPVTWTARYLFRFEGDWCQRIDERVEFKQNWRRNLFGLLLPGCVFLVISVMYVLVPEELLDWGVESNWSEFLFPPLALWNARYWKPDPKTPWRERPNAAKTTAILTVNLVCLGRRTRNPGRGRYPRHYAAGARLSFANQHRRDHFGLELSSRSPRNFGCRKCQVSRAALLAL